ncbi:ABC transporter permease [Chelativorans salis]|uniref:Transport permease protein n=1 Tax=Chelativorans salis TaxID=2978478 RepID=A0ABT2LMI6_9HYPH|nr:ABC transporter permease [Chelativorans sp. EGI FJ00035]MCT7374893.1 ABC transporter permease [Chelativorans sp. EGI FJ00035]
MSEITPAMLKDVPRPAAPSAFSNALVFGWRAILKFKHVPEQLFDLIMTPLMFTLLFTFVFGGALAGSPGEYLQFFLPGILVQTVVFNSVYSGMGLSTDLSKGLFERFRSLPIWSLSPFAGLMVGDVLRHVIAGGIILGIGLALGYRPEAGISGVFFSFLLLIAIGFGTGWIFLVLGLLIRTPMTVMTIGFTFIFPLVFASNIMVRPETMPRLLEAFVVRNPVSHQTTALRGLMAGSATTGEVLLALAAPVVLTIVLAPVVLWLYRRN